MGVSTNNSFNTGGCRNSKRMGDATTSLTVHLKEPLAAISNQHVRTGPHGLHGKLPPSPLLLCNRSVSPPHTSGLKIAIWKRLRRRVLTVAQMCLLVWTQRSEVFCTGPHLRHRLKRSISRWASAWLGHSRCWTAGWRKQMSEDELWRVHGRSWTHWVVVKAHISEDERGTTLIPSLWV